MPRFIYNTKTLYNIFDNTPFVVKENTTNVIKALEGIGENLIKRFSDNQLKLNTDKLFVLLNSQGPNTINIGNLCIKNSLSVIDKNCKKAS